LLKIDSPLVDIHGQGSAHNALLVANDGSMTRALAQQN